MTPIEYWKSLNPDERKDPASIKKQKAYALQAGSTFNYLYAHIFRKSGRSRNPSWRLLVGLVKASGGNVSLDEAIDYFLVQPCKKLAAEMGYRDAQEDPSPEKEEGQEIQCWRQLVGLVKASGGNVSLDEVIDYSLVQPCKKVAAEMGYRDAQEDPSPNKSGASRQRQPCVTDRRDGQ